jgi:hypothetical protein
MKRIVLSTVVVAALLVLAALLVSGQPNGKGKKGFSARLNGFQEVPSYSTTGRGSFRAQVDATETMISYELEYSDLEGTATAAHVHLGQPGVNGGIIAFLCGGGSKGPCPTSGTFMDTLVATDVIGPDAQGIDVEELDELIRAMRSGATYVNVHTDLVTSGEIRGQIFRMRPSRGRGRGGNPNPPSP